MAMKLLVGFVGIPASVTVTLVGVPEASVPEPLPSSLTGASVPFAFELPHAATVAVAKQPRSNLRMTLRYRIAGRVSMIRATGRRCTLRAQSETPNPEVVRRRRSYRRGDRTDRDRHRGRDDA